MCKDGLVLIRRFLFLPLFNRCVDTFGSLTLGPRNWVCPNHHRGPLQNVFNSHVRKFMCGTVNVSQGRRVGAVKRNWSGGRRWFRPMFTQNLGDPRRRKYTYYTFRGCIGFTVSGSKGSGVVGGEGLISRPVWLLRGGT